jgi:DHA1 family inner membrane transport protein
MYTYIAPIVTGVAGLSRSTIPWFLLAFGIGSVVGTFVAGRLADWNVERSVLGGFAASIVTLIAFAVLADHAAAVLLLLFTVSALGSVLAINLQVRLMSASGEARMLGAALNHSALNLANGLGASLGSVVIAAGLGYRAPSIVGGALAAGGLVIFLVGLRRQHTQVRPQPVPQPVAV